GLELPKPPHQPRHRQPDDEGAVARQREPADRGDLVPGIALGLRLGRDDERLVAARRELLQHAADRVRDPVHPGEERFGDDGYTHTAQDGAVRWNADINSAMMRTT